MYRKFKIIPFIPAGRKRTMSILLKHLLRFKGLVDEVQIWKNTQDQGDLEYIKSIGDDFFKIMEMPDNVFNSPKQLNTSKFYVYTQDPQAIYIRFDDDIVFIDDNYFKNLLDFRIDNPQYFIVYGNIWNNAIISYLHQRMGHIGTEAGVCEKEYCMDEIGWKSGKFALYIHQLLLNKIKDGKTSDLFFDRWELHNAKRFSISNFCFFGKEMLKLNGLLTFRPDELTDSINPLDEEIFLTEAYVKRERLLSVICGSALVSHYTFCFQRKEVNESDVLERYIEIAEQKLSASYYQLLDK